MILGALRAALADVRKPRASGDDPGMNAQLWTSAS